MSLIKERLSASPESVALIDTTGREFLFSDLVQKVEQIEKTLSPGKEFILLEADQSVQFVCTYLACLSLNKAVFLAAPDSEEKTARIRDEFRPDSIFNRNQDGDWTHTVLNPEPDTDAYNEELALMLSTSGSTGAPKLVKLSRDNLLANADSIATYLKLTPADRAMASLPFHYSYGLSILNSHLFNGASVVLCDDSVSSEAFWSSFSRNQCTNFSGVPYSYELIEKAGFAQRQLESLRFFTQAGGKLSRDKVDYFAGLAEQKSAEFFVMYGQTEATARIAYLPPERLASDSDTIGIAIPGGTLSLEDDSGKVITEPGVAGEMVYEGPNVMMGYAIKRADLKTPRELQRLKTGDIAEHTADGLFRIVGRKKSFVKIFGLRINLDDMENQLRLKQIPCIVCGNDEQLSLCLTDASREQEVSRYLTEKIGLPSRQFEIVLRDEPPLLPSGKTDKATILRLGLEQKEKKLQQRAGSSLRDRLLMAYSDVFTDEVSLSDSYISLNGDSLSYVYISTVIKKELGYLPQRWEHKPIRELAALQESGPATGLRRFLVPVETEVLFRAVAILTVVISHAKLTNAFHGGAAVLIMLAGFSFARFQNNRLIQGEFLGIGLNTFRKILVPFYVLTIAYLVARQDFYWPVLALVSNYFGGYEGGTGSFLTPFWFIEVYAQIVLLICLLHTISPVRRMAAKQPYIHALGLFVLAVAAQVGLSQVWNTEALYDRVPHMYLYLFMMGWLVYSSQSMQDKVITTVLSVAVLLALNPYHHRFVFSALLLLLVWLPSVRIPGRWTAALFTETAGASFNIYLLHLIPLTFFLYMADDIPGVSPDLVRAAGVAAAIATGIAHKHFQQSGLLRFGWKRLRATFREA